VAERKAVAALRAVHLMNGDRKKRDEGRIWAVRSKSSDRELYLVALSEAVTTTALVAEMSEDMRKAPVQESTHEFRTNVNGEKIVVESKNHD
jgi:hypothetical protein